VAQSSLSSLIKHWAVAQVDGIPLARTSIARILSKCFGDSPVCFKVCTFGPHIFTFLVANANVAAELLIRGEFKAEAVSFIIVPSFRKAFSIAPLTNSEEQTMKSNLNQSLSISQENSPFLLSSSQTAVTEGQTQSCQSPLESTPLAKRSSCAHLSGSSEEQNPPLTVGSQREATLFSRSNFEFQPVDALEVPPCNNSTTGRLTFIASSSNDTMQPDHNDHIVVEMTIQPCNPTNASGPIRCTICLNNETMLVPDIQAFARLCMHQVNSLIPLDWTKECHSVIYLLLTPHFLRRLQLPLIKHAHWVDLQG
jgi:hypothetical protein